MSQLDTQPVAVDQGSAEVLPWAVDFGPNLGDETISAHEATLTDLASTSLAPDCLGERSLEGSQVVQWVEGLTAGHSYQLAITATTSGGKVWTATVTVRCPA